MKRRELLKTGMALAAGVGLSQASISTHANTNAAEKNNDPCVGGRWSTERANAWYAKYPWIMGYNYVPSTAVNQLETWQAETFDPKTIDKELALASSVGLNTARIFLHDVAWKIDPKGFKERLNVFLDLCAKHKTRALVTFFTNGGPGPEKAPIRAGKQPDPDPAAHNPCWLQSPGVSIVNDPGRWSYLEDYVKDVMTDHAKDERILCWCLYNEPENRKRDERTLPLMREVWKWARSVDPVHPLTSPVFTFPSMHITVLPIVCFLGENCDVMSFHSYGNRASVKKIIDLFKFFDRPVICTEYMGRPTNTFFEIAPLMKENNVGAINFGLVRGKCNFHLPWRPKPEDLPEPKVWFHDIFRQDGTPYDPKEVELIKELTGKT